MYRFPSAQGFPGISSRSHWPAWAVVGATLLLTLELAAGPVLAEARKAIIAHRGASGYLPEHTLEAYALAYGQGANYIEPDLVLTQDGVPIALHDRTLEATTNVAERFPDRARTDGRYYAIDLTWEEIKTLEVRERVNAKTGEVASPARFPNTHNALKFRVPTLAELIELVQGMNHSTGRNVGIYPELKAPGWHTDEGHDFARILLDVLTDYGYRTKSDPVVIQSFEPEALLRLRQLGCELRLVQLIGGRLDNPMLTPEGLDHIAKYADGIGPAIPLVLDAKGNLINDNALVTGAHARGLVVHPWTIRADSLPPYAASVDWLVQRLLFEAGADGVFTDHPDQVKQALSRH
jgi:glycerophosphoryl diester phosphodiesterase